VVIAAVPKADRFLPLDCGMGAVGNGAGWPTEALI